MFFLFFIILLEKKFFLFSYDFIEMRKKFMLFFVKINVFLNIFFIIILKFRRDNNILLEKKN